MAKRIKRRHFPFCLAEREQKKETLAHATRRAPRRSCEPEGGREGAAVALAFARSAHSLSFSAESPLPPRLLARSSPSFPFPAPSV